MSEIKSSFARRVSRSSTTIKKSQPTTTSPEQSPIQLKHSSSNSSSSESIGNKILPRELNSNRKRSQRNNKDRTSVLLMNNVVSHTENLNSPRSSPSPSVDKLEPEDQYMTESYWPDIYDSSLIPNLKPQFAMGSQSLLNRIKPLDKGYVNHDNGQDDPLPYLFEEEKQLQEKLQILMTTHREVLTNGNISAKQTRSDILDVLRNLFYINQAFVEIYSKESMKKTGILSSFQGWEEAKLAIKSQIEDIKSDENEHGKRLKQLREESDNVTNEITNLERRLTQLKQKQNVIDKEIDQCQSIIDSRTSQHYENLSQIENYERLAIIQLTSQNSATANLNNHRHNNNHNNNNDNNTDSPLTFSVILSKLSIIKQQNTNPETFNIPQMMETLSLQIESINDKIQKFSQLETNFNETYIIWNDTIQSLNSLEMELQLVIKSRLTSTNNKDGNDQMKWKITELLKKYKDVLISRQQEFELGNQYYVLKELLRMELETLEKGMKLIT